MIISGYPPIHHPKLAVHIFLWKLRRLHIFIMGSSVGKVPDGELPGSTSIYIVTTWKMIQIASG
jgi:hypothetical protein